MLSNVWIFYAFWKDPPTMSLLEVPPTFTSDTFMLLFCKPTSSGIIYIQWNTRIVSAQPALDSCARSQDLRPPSSPSMGSSPHAAWVMGPGAQACALWDCQQHPGLHPLRGSQPSPVTTARNVSRRRWQGTALAQISPCKGSELTGSCRVCSVSGSLCLVFLRFAVLST